MDWRDSSVVGQMTLAMTSCFLCDSPSFRSYCVSVQSAAVVRRLHILCIDMLLSALVVTAASAVGPNRVNDPITVTDPVIGTFS